MIIEATHLVWFSIIVSVQAEERLSWFTKDPEVKKSIFVPDNLPEGKEENRVLPWVFHSAKDTKIMELKCIMRGYNASNNPSDYKEARWSHPGFDKSQVSVSVKGENGTEEGVPYRIWSIDITTSPADAGKKWVTCEFQQGDFPLSTDFKFLIFKKLKRRSRIYVLEGSLEESDLNEQIEADIKRQISEHYKNKPEVIRCTENKKKFCIKKKQQPNKQSRQHQKNWDFGIFRLIWT